ncbi:MAG TPA: SufE family protein [Actinomycetales bacterium]|nr:SufE family protein [Actinomycetales bacterium]
MTADQHLPDALAELVDDFTSVDPPDRLQLLLELSDELPELPQRYVERSEQMEQVHECQTPLFLAVEVEAGDDHVVHLFFDAPPEAPTTRGFAGILRSGLDGLPAEEVLAVPDDVPFKFGLGEAVSPLRLRGMVAMLGRIKRQVREKTAA